VQAGLRRLRCPAHGVRVEGVPFARAGSEFTADFEDLVGYLATAMDKTAICRLVRIDWDSVGRIIERVMATGLDPARLDDLFEIGVDEVAWRKGHSYLTLVSDHRRRKFVWGAEGRDTDTLDGFFDELGKERSGAIEAVSMDMSPAYAKSVAKADHAPQAVICYDPFHVVQLATKALDKVRREVWQEMRALDAKAARRFGILVSTERKIASDQEIGCLLQRRGASLASIFALVVPLRPFSRLRRHLRPFSSLLYCGILLLGRVPLARFSPTARGTPC